MRPRSQATGLQVMQSLSRGSCERWGLWERKGAGDGRSSPARAAGLHREAGRPSTLLTAVSSENENSDGLPLACISSDFRNQWVGVCESRVCRMLTQAWRWLDSQEHTCPWSSCQGKTELVSFLARLCFPRPGCLGPRRTPPFPPREEQHLAPTAIQSLSPVVGHLPLSLFLDLFLSKFHAEWREPCLAPTSLIHSSLFYDFVLKTIGLGCNNTDVSASQENHEFPLPSPR